MIHPPYPPCADFEIERAIKRAVEALTRDLAKTSLSLSKQRAIVWLTRQWFRARDAGHDRLEPGNPALVLAAGLRSDSAVSLLNWLDRAGLTETLCSRGGKKHGRVFRFHPEALPDFLEREGVSARCAFLLGLSELEDRLCSIDASIRTKAGAA